MKRRAVWEALIRSARSGQLLPNRCPPEPGQGNAGQVQVVSAQAQANARKPGIRPAQGCAILAQDTDVDLGPQQDRVPLGAVVEQEPDEISSIGMGPRQGLRGTYRKGEGAQRPSTLFAQY